MIHLYVEGPLSGVGNVHVENVEGEHEATFGTQVDGQLAGIICEISRLRCENDFLVDCLYSHVCQEGNEEDHDSN